MDARTLKTLCRGLAMAAAVALTARGQGTPSTSYRGRILGVFNQAGDPIEGAEVIDVLTQTRALTTKTGTVSLAFLADSGSLIRVQKIGFRPVTMLVSISPMDTVPVTVVLDAVTTVLPAVVTKDSAPHHISPGLQAFEERRRLGFGRFVTEVELRKHDSGPLTNVVRNMGVNVGCSIYPLQCFAGSSRSAGTSCKFDVYVDGVAVNPSDRDLEKMPANQFGGIEAYLGPATIPPLYNKTGSACGVLLLWSRER